jgi:hypothetical protein
MSLTYVSYGVLGLVCLLAALAASMTLAARVAARLVGIESFRWFEAQPVQAAWWRRLAVGLASVLAPLGLSIVVFWASLYVGGVPQATSNRVEVLDGAARAAGMQDGDRVLRIGEEPIRDFEHLRSAVKRHDGKVEIEVERTGQRVLLQVTPRAGKIGVMPQTQLEPISFFAAGSRAVAMPFQVLYRAGHDLVRQSTATKPQLSGPVAIVRETAKARQRSGVEFFTLLAVLAGYLWPFAAMVPLFDVVTGHSFRAAQPPPAVPSLSYQLERFRHALLFACAGYVMFTLGWLLDAADVRFSRILLVWGMATCGAGYPLVWLGAKAKWGRPFAALLLAGSASVPCVLLIAMLVVRRGLASTPAAASGTAAG